MNRFFALVVLSALLVLLAASASWVTGQPFIPLLVLIAVGVIASEFASSNRSSTMAGAGKAKCPALGWVFRLAIGTSAIVCMLLSALLFADWGP